MSKRRNRVAGLEHVAAETAAMAVIGLIAGFVCLLIFCTFVVIRTGDTAGLRDVAIVVRAYASVGASLRASLRIGKKS
jgi:hypothetical protein